MKTLNNPQPPGKMESPTAVAGSAVFTFCLLAIIQTRELETPLLLAERYLPGAGWIESGLLAVYAGWATFKMLDASQSARWRRRLWSLFSIVFFLQLALGMSGVEKMLMSGELHLPVPALIVAGPLFRGEGVFMPIGFLVFVLLIGPAWCSHLCYVGALDNVMAQSRRKPIALPKWRHPLRIGILFLTILAALTLRAFGVGPLYAGALGLAFGLGGIAIMLTLSRRKGAMVHCVSYCPIGVLAVWLGKLSPFRLRIGQDCDECLLCRASCRFDALNKENILNKKPGNGCTLCGDCISECPSTSLHYWFPGLGPQRARALFIALIVSLHAVTLGVARM